MEKSLGDAAAKISSDGEFATPLVTLNERQRRVASAPQ
jgi:hypothetical protein